MLTARAATSAIVSSDIIALGHHQKLGPLRQRQGVGRRKRRRIGEGEEEIVDEARQPVADLAVVQGHLREQEVGMGAIDEAAGRRPAAVRAPEPQGKDDDIGDPNVERVDKQRLAGGAGMARQQGAHQEHQRTAIHDADDAGHHQRGPADDDAKPADQIPVLLLDRFLAGDLCPGGGDGQGHEQGGLQRRRQPARAERKIVDH